MSQLESIAEVLVRRDGLSAEEAKSLIADASVTLQEYVADGDLESAYDVCAEWFGLEPDYIYELM